MELTEELLAQMGAYLSGQMNENERLAFDTRLQQDADLRHEVTIQHEIRQGLSLIAQKQRFKAMHTDLTQRGLLTQPSLNPATESTDAQESNEGKVIAMPVSRPTFWKNRTYMTAAASLILLVGVSWLFLWKQSMPTAEAIQLDRAFNSVFTPDPKSAPVPPTDPDLLGASQPALSDSQDSVQLLKGINLLQHQLPQPAITQLQAIAQGTPGHWRASAQWYLALAYLKNGQINQTDSLLSIITGSNGHPYQLEAQQLTQQLPHESTNRP